MNEEFKKRIDQLPGLLERLLISPLRPWSTLGSLPQKGIYVFFENEHPIYVGRTRDMKRRIRQHGRLSSTHYSASLPFNLAKKVAVEKGIDMGRRRGDLEKDPTFANLFREAKERVSRMSIRVIEINDPITQSLFEVYAHIELDTEFNDFDTH